MIGYYNYTVILTYIGTISGFIGISYICDGRISAALICLMIAGFCDMFDGKVASMRERTRQEKSFGIQIDSLSDLICFGALPSMIVLHSTTVVKYISVPVCCIYLLCGLIRLAWFNVDEEERQSNEGGSRKTYMGLPITTSALLVPLFFGLGSLTKLPVNSISPWFLLCVAIAFITPFKLRKPGTVGKIIMVAAGIAIVTAVVIGVKK
ncbi:MAG: phosphatidylserine synthase [Ruminococcaceae bacterium]|nr:phosphatidylserine synthase [Oscillospiraceae bacterium]